MKSLLLIASFVLATCPVLHASHGQNFLLLEDYDIPAPWHGQVTASFDWEVQDGPDTYVTEPNLLLGILPHVAFGLTSYFADEPASDWDYSSITPRLYLRLPDKFNLPFKAGLSFGYQFAEGHDEEGEGDHHEEEHGHADDHALPAMPHAGGGIDDHDNSLWHTRLLIETDLTSRTKAVFNLIGLFPENGAASWGYGVGVRQMLLDTLAVGVEARGDFESNGQHELLAATYYSPMHDLTFRIGAGFGLTENTPDFVLRTGVIWRF